MSYCKVGTVNEVPAQGGLKVKVGRDEIAIFRTQEGYRAINNLCPHRAAPLNEGFVEQGKVFCPWHCFDFDLRTGESTIAPHFCVTTYPVEVDGEDIRVLYPEECGKDDYGDQSVDGGDERDDL